MRQRFGHFDGERHGKALRVYDWVAPVGTRVADVVPAIEAALGLTLQGAPGGQHGYVTGAQGEEGTYIAITLYEDCALDKCPAGHGTVKHVRASDPTPAALAAAKAAVGEHPQRKLGTGKDDEIADAFKFPPESAPRRK